MDEQFTRQPLYGQVAEALVERIAQGYWQPGSMIPNEVDLAREIGVSTGTMRKALNRLEQNRLIVRRQGRGTFVEDHTTLANLQRFQLLRRTDGEVLTNIGQLLAQRCETASAEEARRLSVAPGRPVLRTTRVMHHQSQPYFYELAVMAVDRFPGFDLADTGDYVLAALGQKHGVLLGQATEKLTLSEAPEEVAAALELDTGTVLMKLDRTINSLGGEPLEWRVGFCPLRDEKYVVTIV